MNTDNRRQRLVDYYKLHFEPSGGIVKGGRTAFAAQTGYTKGRISQLFDPEQPFGELVGTRLAELLGLPNDYFERSPGGLTKRALELAQAFDALPEGPNKDRLIAIFRLFAES